MDLEIEKAPNTLHETLKNHQEAIYFLSERIKILEKRVEELSRDMLPIRPINARL